MNTADSQFELLPEQRQTRELAREVAEAFRDRATTWERSGEFPWPNIKRLTETGLLGISVPERYGGGGGSWLDAALVLEEVGRCCYVTAMAALGELGVQTRALAAYGTDVVKDRYLPGVASGELMCAIGITEPDAGSDVGAITTVAEDDGDHVVVSGRKTLMSRADVARIFVTFARFGRGSGADDVGAVVIDRDTPGLEVRQTFETLGGDGLHEVSFDGCRVPHDHVLVREDGLRRMLSAFNGQRCLNAAISVGIAQGAQDVALEYAQQRRQGGRPIGHHQGIGWMLADNAVKIEAARLLVWRAAAMGEFPTRYEASVAKVFANEMALGVTDSVLQIFGGHGWIREMPAERYLRWARYGPLGGGTPQVQRNGIARQLLRSRDAAS